MPVGFISALTSFWFDTFFVVFSWTLNYSTVEIVVAQDSFSESQQSIPLIAELMKRVDELSALIETPNKADIAALTTRLENIEGLVE